MANFNILKYSLKTNIVKSILTEITSRTSKYYYTFGKNTAWDNENIPDAPSQTYSYELETRKNISYAKLIDSNDAAIVIRNTLWAPGIVYDMYDNYSSDFLSSNGAASIDAALFYVVTDEYNVYKCLFNNNGAASTSKPTTISTEPTILPDNYVWKYMYTIPLTLRNKFFTSEYIPVTNALTNQYYTNGAITSFVIDTKGSKYPSCWAVDSINITSAGNGYAIGDQIIFTAAPTNSGTGIDALAAVTAINVNGGVTGVTLINQGAGYIIQPLITSINRTVGVPSPGVGLVLSIDYKRDPANYTELKVVGDGYTEAKLIPVINANGEIENIIVSDEGAGYTTATVNIIAKRTANTVGAILENVTALNTPGFVQGAISINLNVGAIESPQANVELLAIDGSINTVKVDFGGAGYPPSTIIEIVGDGTGATCTPVIQDGKIVRTIMTNPGQGYTTANIVITPAQSGSSQAQIRPIISPKGGHGKDAVSELYANSIMLVSRLDREKNKNITITNGYRQVSIVKNPKIYNDSNYFRNATGSSCVLLECDSSNASSYQNILKDDLLTYTSTIIGSKTFTLIEKTQIADKYYLLVQYNDNYIPLAGNSLIFYRNNTAYTITVSSVQNPDIDKYSGEMIYIDNRTEFESSDEQIVTISTLISF
jgi:hypothetical protein